MTDREILEAVLVEVRGLEDRMERMEKTDRNISILAENHLNLINKMDVSATWTNRVMINEIKINALTDQVSRLQMKCS